MLVYSVNSQSKAHNSSWVWCQTNLLSTPHSGINEEPFTHQTNLYEKSRNSNKTITKLKRAGANPYSKYGSIRDSSKWSLSQQLFLSNFSQLDFVLRSWVSFQIQKSNWLPPSLEAVDGFVPWTVSAYRWTYWPTSQRFLKPRVHSSPCS